jgi:hypothetical protein
MLQIGHGVIAASLQRKYTATPHLVLNRLGATVGLQLAPLGHHRADHALLLQVLVPPILSQLHNVVFPLPPGVIEVDACRNRGAAT